MIVSFEDSYGGALRGKFTVGFFLNILGRTEVDEAETKDTEPINAVICRKEQGG